MEKLIRFSLWCDEYGFVKALCLTVALLALSRFPTGVIEIGGGGRISLLVADKTQPPCGAIPAYQRLMDRKFAYFLERGNASDPRANEQPN